MTRMLNSAEYRAALVAARDEWHSKNHPFFRSWAKGELTKDAMKAYVQQHYNFVSNASRYYGIIYGLCPWWDARNFYLENLNEEEDPTERHVDKLAKFGIALGMTVEESRTAPDLPTTAALKDFILNTTLTRGTLHATAVIIVGLESQVPQLYEPIVPALRDTYGFTDDEIEFFLLHITADVEHGEKGFQILLEHTEDHQTQLDVIETVREAAKKRWFYMDGMQLQYVEGRPWYPVRAAG
jgi:pyrroloquinoline-quinone synthase